ncbi:MAG: histidinol-phosphatase [Paracoccaceae bacterium]
MTGGTGHALTSIAHRAADAARRATMPVYRAEGLDAEDKGPLGAYDPVTAADKAAEASIRAVLAEERPEDGVLGEEEAARPGRSGFTWVVDPIDGTRAFLIGAPTWGTLIALNDGVRPVLGLVDQPASGDRFWGDGEGAWLRRDGGSERRLSVRRGVGLDEARLCTTYPEIGDAREQAAFVRVRDRVRLTRYGLDCTAYCLLAAGGVDIVIEAGLQPYDVQAVIPVVEGAGGRLTTWEGGDAQHGGRILAAATPELHAAAMELLAG